VSLPPIRFHPAARQEFWHEVAFYDRHGQGLGDELATDVERVIQDIRHYPEMGATDSAGTRRAKVHRFPFNIIYRVQAEQIVLVAFAHHSRKPEYWRKRM
jgi:hypothetical protein